MPRCPQFFRQGVARLNRFGDPPQLVDRNAQRLVGIDPVTGHPCHVIRVGQGVQLGEQILGLGDMPGSISYFVTCIIEIQGQVT